MNIKHGRRIFGEIHEVRKGLWAFLFVCLWACLSDADWLDRQTLITWRELLITLEHFLECQPKFINILYCIPEVRVRLFGPIRE